MCIEYAGEQKKTQKVEKEKKKIKYMKMTTHRSSPELKWQSKREAHTQSAMDMYENEKKKKEFKRK